MPGYISPKSVSVPHANLEVKSDFSERAKGIGKSTQRSVDQTPSLGNVTSTTEMTGLAQDKSILQTVFFSFHRLFLPEAISNGSSAKYPRY